MILSTKEIRQLQLIELELLKEFIAICDKLGLRYYVLGGTMLGAVRHNGFIPWDDDIDVGMMREDYEIFLKEAQALLPSNLFLQSHNTEPGFYWNAAKIRNSNTTFIEGPVRNHKINQGIYIDIFPLDYYPVTKVSQKWLIFKAKIAAIRVANECVWEQRGNPIKRLLKRLANVIYPSLFSAVDAREKMFKTVPPSNMIANYSGQWGLREVVPAQWYGEGCILIFEGIAVRAPQEYDKWLTQVYGDYMKLPPKEKRISHHNSYVIDMKRPYMDYFGGNSEEIE